MKHDIEEIIAKGMALPMPETPAQMYALRAKCGLAETNLDDLLGWPEGTTRKTHSWRMTMISRQEAAFLAGFDAAAQELSNSLDLSRPLIMFARTEEFAHILCDGDRSAGTNLARLIYNEAMMRAYYDGLWEDGRAPALIWFDRRSYAAGEDLHQWAERHMQRLRVKEDTEAFEAAF